VGNEGVNVSSVEVKIVFKEGEDIRVLRGQIDHEDEFFVFVKRNDGIFRINKQFIIKIEEGNND
jgi:hypothetical protein